jgi:hypothetical protein
MQNKIISLTTLPTRLHKIEPTINSIKSQGLPVYLFIPREFKRKGIKFNGKIPDFLKNKNIHIEVVEDQGPITKMIYAIDIADVVITVDDDNIFNNKFVKNLLYYHDKHPNEALCSTGVLLKKGSYKYSKKLKNMNRRVDIVLGCQGVLYQSNFFDENIWKFKDYPPAKFVDDVWISGCLANKGTQRRCVPVGMTMINKDIKFIDNLATINKRDNNNNKVIKMFKW